MGFVATFGLFGWMTWRAWKLRDALDLNEMERLVTREELVRCFSLAGLGCAGVLAAIALPDRAAGMSGLLYGLIGVIEFVIGLRFGKATKPTLARMRERGEWPGASAHGK